MENQRTFSFFIFKGDYKHTRRLSLMGKKHLPPIFMVDIGAKLFENVSEDFASTIMGKSENKRIKLICFEESKKGDKISLSQIGIIGYDLINAELVDYWI